jgi:hypothetical protein|tara:strand:- start:8449 stop:8580 length:132 start_codon:yes stop_codon:yes gene_type:complete
MIKFKENTTTKDLTIQPIMTTIGSENKPMTKEQWWEYISNSTK